MSYSIDINKLHFTILVFIYKHYKISILIKKTKNFKSQYAFTIKYLLLSY